MIQQIAKRESRRPATAFLAVLLCAVVSPVMAAVENDLPPQLAQLHNSGRYQELAQALQTAVADQPQSAPLHYWLGRSYYELHDYDRAESSLERAAELAPGRSEYHDWLGKASGRKAERANPFSAMALARKAHHAFETAVRLAPTNIEAQRDLISYLLNAPSLLGGGEGEALKQIQALSVVDPVDGTLARAEFFSSRKRFDQAAAEYDKIEKMNPRRIGVEMEIADFYRDRGDGDRMQAVVDAADKIDPTDSRLDYYRGVALVLAKQDSARAERHLRLYLQKVPDGSQVPSHSSAYEWLGKLYEAEGKRDQAAAEYQAALSSDPRNDAARKALDRVRAK
jgi:tetratricopeptide (TPR) repeat protein